MREAHDASRYSGSSPDLGIKRWLLLAAVGFVVLLDGADRWIVAEGVDVSF